MKKTNIKLTDAERQAASRRKRKAEGMEQINLWLSTDTIGAIDKVKQPGQNRAEIIEKAVKFWLESEASESIEDLTEYGDDYGSW